VKNLQRCLVIGGLAFALSACGSPTAPTPRVPPISTQPEPAPPALNISCPGGATAQAFEGASVAVPFAPPTTTGGVAPVEVRCTRESGSLFAGGTTTVQCTATDAARQSTSCLFDVVVRVLPPQLTLTKFLAFGDSMTSGEVSVPTSVATRQGEGPHFSLIVVPAASYPSKLQDVLRRRYVTQSNSVEVVNAGLPGEWAQDGARRLPGVLANARPQVVILLEGINDVGTQLDLGVGRAGIALDSMAKEARHRGIRVILSTLPPSRMDGTHTVATRLIQDYNARLRSIAVGEGAVLVDLYEGMVTDLPRYIGIDGLHPTEAGYERMAELIFAAIRKEFEAK
jgi:lysophospholipase L1-like esterase